MDLRKVIRTIPDFPKKGIMFRDITTLIKNPSAFKYVIDQFASRYKGLPIDIICGIEARGFIFGSALAHQLGISFVVVRKQGKLPAAKEGLDYELEYGKDRVEIHVDAIPKGSRVLVVDDLIATGGTAAASCKLIEKLGGKVIECAFIIELPDLKGRDKLQPFPAFSLVSFEGE